MKTKKTKKIIITAKEWIDRLNGNSYFAVKIELENETLFIPFTYGYDAAYLYASIKELQKNNVIPSSIKTMYDFENYCDDNEIVLFYEIQRKCLKRELKQLVNN